MFFTIISAFFFNWEFMDNSYVLANCIRPHAVIWTAANAAQLLCDKTLSIICFFSHMQTLLNRTIFKMLLHSEILIYLFVNMWGKPLSPVNESAHHRKRYRWTMRTAACSGVIVLQHADCIWAFSLSAVSLFTVIQTTVVVSVNWKGRSGAAWGCSLGGHLC